MDDRSVVNKLYQFDLNNDENQEELEQTWGILSHKELVPVIV